MKVFGLLTDNRVKLKESDLLLKIMSCRLSEIILDILQNHKIYYGSQDNLKYWIVSMKK